MSDYGDKDVEDLDTSDYSHMADDVEDAGGIADYGEGSVEAPDPSDD